MTTEVLPEFAVASDDSEPRRVLALVADDGDRRVLTEWVRQSEAYAVVPDDADLRTVSFDCCIVDPRGLLEQGDVLEARRAETLLPLPVLLVVPEARVTDVHRRVHKRHPGRWDLVDGILQAPLTKLAFKMRLDSLVRIRRQASTLHQHHEQLRAIRDKHAGHGLILTDTGGRIQYANRAFEEQSGRSSEEVIGANPRILQSGEHDEAFYEELWKTILAGDVWRSEIINERKDGERYVVDQTIAPIRGATGDIEQFVAINHEITDLKELEASLRQRGEQLALLNRVLRHDVRNDMNVIQGWVETLADHVDEEGEPILDHVRSAADHVVELTGIAREFVESIHAEDDPDLEPVALSAVLTQEVARRRQTFGEATIERDEPPAVTVAANELLAAVFRNLINNAVQHNDTDDPTVTITTEDRGESVIVRVADDGPGIPDEHKAELFGADTKGLESDGTGMGLYLVERLVDIYGGDVRVEDNTPRGTVFEVELLTIAADTSVVEEP